MAYKDVAKRKAYLKEKNKEYREKRRLYKQTDLHKARVKELAAQPKHQFKNAIRYSKRRNIPFLLTMDEFIIERNKPCFYCENKLGCKSLEGTGLDRLDNSKGYEPGNIVSCCKVCNTIKSDQLTVEETKAAVEAIIAVRNKYVPVFTPPEP